MKKLVCVALIAVAPACVELDDEADVIDHTEQEILGGTVSPDYYQPWAVRLTGTCGGTLIHPEWVLTAAHCVAGTFGNIRVGTTDPVTGEAHYRTAQRNLHASEAGVYIHPDYDPGQFGNSHHDIALVRVKPVSLDRFTQTAALPDRPWPNGGGSYLVSKVSHDGSLPAGQLKKLSLVMEECGTGNKCAEDAEGSGCPGDSGSGAMRLESEAGRLVLYGAPRRATVFGVASYTADTSCNEPGSLIGFVDVYQHKGWILDTIANSTGWGTTPQNEVELEGNVTVRRAGFGGTAPGELTLTCIDQRGNPVSGSAPMDVPGVGLGFYCVPFLGDVEVSCGVRSGSLASARIDRLRWKSTALGEQVFTGSRSFVKAAFRGSVPGSHVFTCETSQVFRTFSTFAGFQ